MCAVLRYQAWAMGELHRQEEALLHRDRIRGAERGRTDFSAPIDSEDSEGLKNPQLRTHLSVALAHQAMDDLLQLQLGGELDKN